MNTVFCIAWVYITIGSSEFRFMFPRRLVIIASIVKAPASSRSSIKTQIAYFIMVILCVGFCEYLYIIMRLIATTVIPNSTRMDDHTKYIVSLKPRAVIHWLDSKGLNTFINTIANIETKSTIIIWFLFSRRYLGAFENNIEVYVVAIILSIAYFSLQKYKFF